MEASDASFFAISLNLNSPGECHARRPLASADLGNTRSLGIVLPPPAAVFLNSARERRSAGRWRGFANVVLAFLTLADARHSLKRIPARNADGASRLEGEIRFFDIMSAFHNEISNQPTTTRCRMESWIREKPLQGMGAAAAAGAVVSVLPIFAILRLSTQAALRLARPALLVLGLVKGAELLRSRSS